MRTEGRGYFISVTNSEGKTLALSLIDKDYLDDWVGALSDLGLIEDMGEDHILSAEYDEKAVTLPETIVQDDSPDGSFEEDAPMHFLEEEEKCLQLNPGSSLEFELQLLTAPEEERAVIRQAREKAIALQ